MSLEPCAARWQRRVDRAFVRELSVRAARTLAHHLTTCAGCASYACKLDHVRAVLNQRPLRSELAERGASATNAVSRWRLGALLGLGAAALAALALLVVIRGRHTTSSDEFVARGGGAAVQPGVLLACVDPGSRRVTATVTAAAAPLPVPELRCNIDGSLQIAYSTLGLRSLHMIAFAAGSDGAIRWYVPRLGDGDALALPTGAVDVLVPWSTRLAVKHQPGVFEVEVRILDAALPADQARTAPAISVVRARLVIDGEARQ